MALASNPNPANQILDQSAKNTASALDMMTKALSRASASLEVLAESKRQTEQMHGSMRLLHDAVLLSYATHTKHNAAVAAAIPLWSRASFTLQNFHAHLVNANNAIPNMTKAFALAGASAAAFINAASPDIYRTLTGSVTLVSAAIGRILTPVILQATLRIQEFYHWLMNLSPEMKKLIIQVVEGVAVFGAAVVGMKLFTFALTLLASKTNLAAGALGLLAVGVVALRDSIMRTAEELDKTTKDAADSSRMTSGQLKASDLAERMSQGLIPEKDREAWLQKVVNTRRDELRKASKEHSDAADWAGTNMATAFLNSQGLVFGETTETSGAKMVAAQKRYAEAEQLLRMEQMKKQGMAPRSGSEMGLGSFGTVMSGLGAAAMNKSGGSVAPAMGGQSPIEKLLFASLNQNMPAIESVDRLRSKLQINALKDDSIEQEMKKIATEQRDALLKMVESSKQIEQNTSKKGLR